MKKIVSKKFVSTVLGIAFVIAAFFGARFTMQMDSQGTMKNCPFFGHIESVCAMTVTEHITKWQQLFTFTPPSNEFLYAALLLAMATFIAFSFRFYLLHQLNFQTFDSRAAPLGYSENFLTRAFGRGVLRKRE